MSQQPYSELTDSEDVRRFEAFLTQKLTPTGITPKVAVDDGCLYVLLEAEQAPEYQRILAIILEDIEILNDFQGHSLRIYGRRAGEVFTDWIYELKRDLDQNWSLEESAIFSNNGSFAIPNYSSSGSINQPQNEEAEVSLLNAQRLQEAEIQMQFLVLLSSC